ncbi:MAG: SpoIID/LytB domain-containing protein [Acidobacteria bacterium]|nr:SpoIID/LytB domain-containing protein [Acidobacteriota bacterium]
MSKKARLSSLLILLVLWPQFFYINVLAIEGPELTAKKYVRPMPKDFFTRPRRINNVLAKIETPKPKTSLEPKNLESKFPKPDQETELSPTGTLVIKTLDFGKGPEIRIALATDVGFAQVTSSQPIAYFNPKEQQLVALSVNEVKVQMGTVRERPGQVYRVQVANLKTNQEAERLVGQLRKQFTEPIFVNFDRESEKYEVGIGDFYSADQAKTFMVQVMNAGYKKTWVSKFDQEPTKYKTKMIKAVATSGSSIATANDRMVLASQDDELAPLYYNGKPYRGQLEIFTNKRGRLSVINRLQMEDYVRGVVANELSPGAFPMLEALKAQAVAARTYAVRNLGQFDAEGYDLLSTPLSQVYGGKGTEHQLTNKAVEETSGIIASYDGKPINALYTSTCGGTTESSEFVFTEPVPYLVSVDCSSQGRARRSQPIEKIEKNDKANKNSKNNNLEDLEESFSPRQFKTSRRFEPVIGEGGRVLTREIATLSILNFTIPENLSNSFLQASPSDKEVLRALTELTELTGQRLTETGKEVTSLGNFSSLLLQALYGQDSPSRLLSAVDADYLLGRDAKDIAAKRRMDVAALLQEGILSPYPDGSLHPRSLITRSTMLLAISRSLAKLGKPALESGTSKPLEGRRIKIKTAKNKEAIEFELTSDCYLFRIVNNEAFPMTSVEIIGGEKLNYHLDSKGRIDYLEIQPNPNGAASDRFSVFSRWQVEYSPEELKARLVDARVNVGDILDVKISKYGLSQRAAELKVIGSQTERTITGLRIRSALGLRESLFIVLREYDQKGEIKKFRFSGRGWGHGVGMCQVGAYGLAVDGLNYEEILKIYYRGIDLVKKY